MSSIFENFAIPQGLIPSDPRFGCGPSLVPVERVEALLKTGKHLLGTSHRQSAVKKVVAEVIEGLRQYFHIPKDYDVVLGNGGATLLFDMLPLTLVEKNITHFTCGEFSQKWYQSSAKIPWITAQEKSVKMGQGITPTDVPGADFIAVTLNETSTGVQIDELPKIQNKTDGPLVGVDATSGAGQVSCDISQTDVFFFSPQKVFASEGGLWVAFMSPRAVERSVKIGADKGRYIPEIFRFEHAIDNSRKSQTYNTPAISTLFFLNEQIKELNVLGYEKVCGMAEEKAQWLYNWAKEKSYLSAYIKEEKYRSRAVATIDVDEKVKVEGLTEYLTKKKLVYGIDAYRKLGRNQLRISLFHNITFGDLQKLTGLLSAMMEFELGHNTK